MCLIKIKRSRFILNHLFKIYTTLWILLLKSIKLVYATKMLVSSANSISTYLSFIILGRSFTSMYVRKSKGPKTEPCGTTCNTLAQLDTLSPATLLHRAVL